MTRGEPELGANQKISSVIKVSNHHPPLKTPPSRSHSRPTSPATVSMPSAAATPLPASHLRTSERGVPPTHALSTGSAKACALEPFSTSTVLDVAYAQSVRDILQVEYSSCSSETVRSLQDSFDKLSIEILHPYPSSILSDGVIRPVLNMSLVKALGQLVSKGNMSLQEIVHLVRNQHQFDTRPNKRLDPDLIDYLYRGTPHHDLMVRTACVGFNPVFSHPEPIQQVCPDNHRSAKVNIEAVTKFIRAGQDDGSMVVLPASFMQTWRDDPSISFHTSPMGVVPKKNEVTATDGRVILDLSWPRGASLNDYTLRKFVPVTEWAPAADVGRRIDQLSREAGWDPDHPERSPIFALIGDVNAAFRNIPNHSSNVKWFGFFVPELEVIVFDMSAPFGWSASPMFYGVFGNGISTLVRRESPHDLNPHLSEDTEKFFCYEWVDDYILLELNTPGRLQAAETALRLAMTLTLGHTAIHPRKFAEKWEQLVHYLGLDWCLRSCSVSMPIAKIEKDLARVEALLSSPSVSKLQLQRLVGSLRHVSTCIPAARPFYQRLQSACRIPRGSKYVVTVGLKADCEWFKEILRHGQLQSIPVSIFADIAPPDLHLYMDACDYGLVVLNLALREYILIEFDSLEREAILKIRARTAFLQSRRKRKAPSTAYAVDPMCPVDVDFSINVREFFSVALAVLVWGHTWNSPGRFFHVKAWIDNTSAVSWCNKLASPNTYGQQLLRVMGLSMARNRIHLSANHMPGEWNHMADAGSRSMSCKDSAKVWSSFSDSWSRAQVSPDQRYCYRCNSQASSSRHWPQPHDAATRLRGTSGTPGATRTATLPSSTEQKVLSPGSCSSLSSSFSTTRPLPTTVHPSSPRSARSIGVIKPSSDSRSACPQGTESPLTAWLAPARRSVGPIQSTRPSSGPSTALPSARHPNETMSFGAPWSSPTSFVSVPASTPARQPRQTTTSAPKTCPSRTARADSRAPSRTLKPSISSSGAVRATELNGAAPGTCTGLATLPAVQSSLRGACERLASRSAPALSSRSARTPTLEEPADKSPWPSCPKR